MAELIVGKLIFADQSLYYGLELCLKNTKYRTYYIDKHTAWACDVILISLFWYRDILKLEKFLCDSDLKNRKSKPILIAGGLQSTVTPELVAEMVDYVFLGDGEEYVEKILDDIAQKKELNCEYLYRKGSSIIPKPAENKNLFPMLLQNSRTRMKIKTKKKTSIRSNFLKKISNVYRIEIARGCRHKCPFCLMSGLKCYRENSFDSIKKMLDEIPEGKTVVCFAPDRAAHSEWDKIQDYILSKKLRDFGSDVRLENMNKINTDSAILGLEGISYRLRKTVNKNYTDEFILERLGQFCTTGRRKMFGANIGMYFIADLPTENSQDWEELRSLFNKISKADWSRQLTINMCLNPLSPKPFTAFKDVIINPFRNYPELWKKIVRGGDGNSRWGFRIKEYNTFMAFERTLDTIIHRGGKLAYKIITKIPQIRLLRNPNNWERSIFESKLVLKECNKIGLTQDILKYYE